MAFFEITLANKIKIKLVTLSHTFGRLEKNNICDSFLPLLPESYMFEGFLLSHSQKACGGLTASLWEKRRGEKKIKIRDKTIISKPKKKFREIKWKFVKNKLKCV